MSLKWGFEVNVHPQSEWLCFLRSSGESQKHISVLNGALATGCEATALYSKKPLLFFIPVFPLRGRGVVFGEMVFIIKGNIFLNIVFDEIFPIISW